MPLSILGQTSANVGQILGDDSKGVLKNIIIFGGALSASDTADDASLQTALVAKSKKAKTASDKFYFLPEVQNFEDKAEQNSTGALNLGPTVMLKEGKAGYEIRVDGTSEFAKQMRKWNNKTVALLEHDSNRKIWGRQVGDNFQGYAAKIFVNAMRVASGQAPEEGIVTITISYLSSTEYADQAKAIDVSNVDLSLVATQNDAPFRIGAVNVTNVHKLAWGIPLAVQGKYFDVIAKFATEIGTNTSLFEAHTGTNYGTPLNITSVAQVNGLLNVTFDSTAYNALGAGTKIRFQAKDPATLAAAGITDIESVAVILTK